MEETELKKCPYCAEDININAIKCKHCKSDLEEKKKLQAKKPIRVKTTEDSFLTRSRGFGDIIIYGPLFFIILVLLLKGCT